MPHFGDDLFLGGATLTPYPTEDFPSGFGVGPLGRVFVYDIVPLTLNAANIAASQTPTGTTVVLTAGTSVTSVTNNRGETVLQLDVPRAVSIFLTAGGTPRAYVVTGYDYAGQKMSEQITSVANATTNGKKAFKQILSITGAGGSVQPITVGTTDILGLPVRVNDRGYVTAGWNNTLARDAGTLVVADTTDPATTTTGDVRGTYVPSSATDGSKRLIVTIALPTTAVGPTANRAGAFGLTQNLGTT